MEAGGQLHAPAVLSIVEEPSAQIEKETEWVSLSVWTPSVWREHVFSILFFLKERKHFKRAACCLFVSRINDWSIITRFKESCYDLYTILIFDFL